VTDPNGKDAAEKKVAYLAEWLRRIQELKRLEPEVTKMWGTATWEADAMRTLRSESPRIAQEVDTELAPGLQALTNSLPLLPVHDLRAMSSTTAVVSGANTVFNALIAAGDQQQSPTGFVPLITRYWQMQEEQGREADAASRVAELFPSLADRFAEASRAARVALGNPTSFAEETAAMAMRNFLLKLKGELMDKARRVKREDPTWMQMAERLCTGPNVQLFLSQEHLHRNLNDWLSRIGKARPSAFTFKDTWARFIDHAYIVCGAVLAGRGPQRDSPLRLVAPRAALPVSPRINDDDAETPQAPNGFRSSGNFGRRT